MLHRQIIIGAADLHEVSLEPLTTDTMKRMGLLLDLIEARLRQAVVMQSATPQA